MHATSVLSNASPTSRPNSTISPASGTLNGRYCTAAPAVSPRITCYSRWWHALAQGGVKGWYNWRVGVQKYERLSVAEQQNKPVRAAAAIRTALMQAASNKKVSDVDFNNLITKAHWYGLDADKEIHSVFLNLKQVKLDGIKKACEGIDSVAWLIQKIDKKTEKVNALKEKLKDGIYRSATASTKRFLVNGPSQKEFWEEMDRSFESTGSCHLKDHVAFAIAKDSIWNLLPFAELQFKGVDVGSKVLEQTCIQAWEKLSRLAEIDFGKLTDSELDKFIVMVDHPELKHLASACKLEKTRRDHIMKCEKLAAYLKERVQNPMVSSDESFFDDLSQEDISKVALRVIVKLNLSDALKISNLQSSQLADMWLIETAKAQLKTPSVALMDDLALIDYLTSAECKKLPTDAFKRIEAEAGKRAEQVYGQSCSRLQSGLQSDSCNELVRSALEFSARFKLAAQLDDAANSDGSEKALPACFAKMLATLTKDQKKLARNLTLELGIAGQEEVVAHLDSVIQISHAKALLPLPAREKQLFATALSQYIPGNLPIASPMAATSAEIELGRKFLDLFQAYILNDNDFRKVRTAEDRELPVSAQFVTDQRSSNLQLDGRPVFNRHIPFPNIADTKRAEEFVKKMRALKGISDEQIMTASRIASQSVGAVLKLLTRDEKLFALTDKEADHARIARGGWGLMPAHPDHQENFVFNKDGSLTVHFRIFKESADLWSGESSGPGINPSISVETDPDKSSFSAELRFEVDPKGIIQEVVFGNSAFERANVRKVDDDYGKCK